MADLLNRRVVITGLGAVTNIGQNVSDTWNGLLTGKSGIGPITSFEQNDEWKTKIAGEKTRAFGHQHKQLG